jgi:polyhydroxyalkanoate synthase
VLGGSGHIAGVINPPAKGRGYWVNDKPSINADAWFESAEANKGSWWPDWMAWLKSHSGKWIDSPAVGNENYPSLVPAPGTYILEM